MIAAVAERHQLTVLHYDSVFQLVGAFNGRDVSRGIVVHVILVEIAVEFIGVPLFLFKILVFPLSAEFLPNAPGERAESAELLGDENSGGETGEGADGDI